MKIKANLFFFFFLCVSFYAQAQGTKPPVFPFQKWDTLMLNKANTGEEFETIDEQEKRIVQLVNMCRTNPVLFLQTYVEHYIDSTNYNKQSKWVTTLRSDLKRIKKPLPLLTFDEELRLFAEAHAEFMGQKGKTGHGNFVARTAELPIKYTNTAFAENCQYGDTSTLEIVMSWLIDEGVENMEHRKNILNPKFTHTGISMRPHKKYGSNCVMEFSAIENRPPLNVPWQQWDSTTIAKANTGEDAEYLNSEEQRVILLVNLCRINPKLFLETYVLYYLDSVSYKENKWSRDLKQELKRMKVGLKPLTVEPDLYKLASEHATKMGSKGKTGNSNLEKRAENLPAKFGKFALGENCQYGTPNALDIVMKLLLDEGAAVPIHRQNILNLKFKYIGVAIKPHKKLEYNCVINFAN